MTATDMTPLDTALRPDAATDAASAAGSNPYESDALLHQYLGFHYGEDYFGVPNYPAHCARLCLQFMQGRRHRLALDLGCAVGRATFELATRFEQVIGVDLSGRFIDAAQRLAQGNTLTWQEQIEGQIVNHRSVCLRDTPLREPFANSLARVQFRQGDASQPACEPGQADLVFAGNLIDRVSHPAAFLETVKALVAPGGLLILSSPYTLLPEYTPVTHWIGGLVIDGQPRTMLQGIAAHLQDTLSPVGDPLDVPFIIRETARKFQHSVAQMSVWQRH